MTTIKYCPVCNSEDLQKEMKCNDFLVTGEEFTLVTCSSCKFKFTNPRPEDGDLGKYYKSENYISHTNTKQGLISKLYHLVRSYTLKKKVRMISEYVSRGTILDYGCGTGMFLNACKQAGFTTFGVEPDSGAREIAKGLGLNVVESKLKLEQGTKFDIITLWHVLEHVTDLDVTVERLVHHLHENGTIVIAVPNHKSFDANHYGKYWAAYDVPRHLYHFDKTSISNLMNGFSFRLIKTLPMKFDSFYVSMLSEKYKTGKTNYLKAFFIGLRSNLIASSPTDYSSVIYILKRDT